VEAEAAPAPGVQAAAEAAEGEEEDKHG